MLRDRIVCGINDDAIQKRLLSEPGLDYAKARETAAQGMKQLRNKSDRPTSPSTVHRTSANSTEQGASSKPTCYRCGIPGHTVSKCRVDQKVVCHNCDKKGHLKRACRSKSSTAKPKGATGRTTRRRSQTVHRVDEDDSESEEEEEQESKSRKHPIQHLKTSKPSHTPPIQVHVKVRVDVSMEVDTGASVSLMSECTFRRLWPQRELHPSKVRLHTYSKDPLSVLGCCSVNIGYLGQTAKMPLQIVAGSGPTLMGRDWLS